jgi:hypothetical protein
MAPAPQQFAINGVPGLPAGAQILSPAAAPFQAGQFATAATLAQPTMQQALQQDPQDPTKWHVVQVATAPALAAAPAATLQTMQESLASNSATHTAQLVTTVSASALSNDRNGKFDYPSLILYKRPSLFAGFFLSANVFIQIGKNDNFKTGFFDLKYLKN